jgi:hypothetical protein
MMQATADPAAPQPNSTEATTTTSGVSQAGTSLS